MGAHHTVELQGEADKFAVAANVGAAANIGCVKERVVHAASEVVALTQPGTSCGARGLVCEESRIAAGQPPLVTETSTLARFAASAPVTSLPSACVGPALVRCGPVCDELGGAASPSWLL